MSIGTKGKLLGCIVLFAMIGFQASADTTGSIAISGSVPAIIAITVSGEAAASNLPLTTTVTDLAVATVVERSNKKAGYTVRLESASAIADGSSGPSLKSAETQDVLPYTVKYDGTAVTFAAGVATVSNTNGKTSAVGVSKTLAVSFDGASNFLDESVYGDTLTFTIIAK